MNKINQNVTRSNVNTEDVRISEIPKSGHNLSHSSMFSGSLGRLIPAAHQHLLGGDSISGSNTAQITFDQLAVPIISPMDVHQYNFVAYFRGLMRSDLYEKIFKMSNRKQNVEYVLPNFTLADLCDQLAYLSFGEEDFNLMHLVFLSNPSVWTDLQEDIVGNFLSDFFAHYKNSSSYSILNGVYLDTIEDLADALRPFAAVTPSTLEESKARYFNVVCTVLDYFCGEGSLLDMLGYNIVRHADVEYFIEHANANQTLSDFIYNSLPMSELPLRAYHNIWAEYFRNVDFEPLTDDLDFRTWDLTCRLSSDFASYFWLLLLRPMQWDADLFTGAQLDDISQHVFAPMVTTTETIGKTPDGNTGFVQVTAPTAENKLRNMTEVSLSYAEEGVTKSLTIPLPTSINDTVLRMGNIQQRMAARLDLQVLRNANKLERFLMRNKYFGDEYRDYMRSHYGVDLTDLQMVRPQYLTGSVDSVDPRQEVSNAGTAETPQGTRMATATATLSGKDAFRLFVEEHAIYMNIFCVLPRAQYDPMTPQLLALRRQDFPVSEFNGGLDEVSVTAEVARSSRLTLSDGFGHHPYGHAWRGRANEIHGRFLSSMRDCTFLRFFQTQDADTSPKLNWQFLHCHPYLGAFANTILLDGQFYVQHEHNFAAQRILLTPSIEC